MKRYGGRKASMDSCECKFYTRMKIIIVIIFCVAVSLTNRGAQAESGTDFPTAISPSCWKLVWQDDFSGGELDTAKWERCPEWERQGGACWWSDRESFLDGEGNLVLRIRKEGKRVVAGAVRTTAKNELGNERPVLFQQAFGYFEMRAQLPVIPGGWAAFWLMPAAGFVPDDGSKGAEIDIIETIHGEKGWVNHALYWGGYGSDTKGVSHDVKNIKGLYSGLHTFGLLWTPVEYVFYVDDIETWRTSAGGAANAPAYMKITLEASKGARLEKSFLMLIDRIRVYSKR
jgi:beta-glucanase (GH16 family)